MRLLHWENKMIRAAILLVFKWMRVSEESVFVEGGCGSHGHRLHLKTHQKLTLDSQYFELPTPLGQNVTEVSKDLDTLYSTYCRAQSLVQGLPYL